MFDDFDTQEQCEEFYTTDDWLYITEADYSKINYSDEEE